MNKFVNPTKGFPYNLAPAASGLRLLLPGKHGVVPAGLIVPDNNFRTPRLSEDLCRVVFGVDFVDDVFNDALFINDERDPSRAHIFAAIH